MALIVKIGANMQNFDKQMKKLTKDVKAVGTKLQGAGMALTAGVTVPLVAVGAAAVKTGMDFESSMSKVSAISGATGDDLATLEAKAREMGATTQFSAKEAADAFSFMAMAGWKTEDMLNGIDGIMSLAAASGEDLAMVSDIVTDSLTAFGMSAQDSGKFADILAAASSNANTNVSMLGESFKMVAPVAGAMGYSVEDTSKALSLMANAGIKGSESGTALRTMMTNLTKPTKAMQDAMDELGISITNSDGSMKSFDEVMLDLRGSFDGLEESQQAAYAATIFGKEAMAGALSVINASEADYNKLSGAINNAEGSASTMAATMNDNLAGRLKEMKSALEEMGLVIYERLQPALEQLVSVAKSLADGFNNLSPATQSIIIGIGILAAAIGPLLLVVGTGIILFGQMQAALTVLGVSFAAIAAPIAIAIAAIIAIIAIFVLFGDEIKAVWNKTFKPIIDKMISIIVTAMKPAFDAAFKAISTIVKDAFQIIKRVWNEILKPVFDALMSFIRGVLLPAFKVVFTAIGSVVKDAFNGIKTVWNNVLKPILNGMIDFISGVFTGNWSKAWSGVVKIFGGIFEGIKTFAKAPLNAVISMVNAAIGAINGLSVKIPNWVPKYGGSTFGVNLPKIPMLAKGGNVFGNGSAIVGEAGPELIQKSGSSVKVTPLSAQEKAGGIGGAVGANGVLKMENVMARINIGGHETTGLIEFITEKQGNLKNRSRRQFRGGFA